MKKEKGLPRRIVSLSAFEKNIFEETEETNA
jgi:hypothetical protein